MHPAQIHAALKMRELSQAEVARMCDVTRATVHQVIHGRSRSARIERRIAAATGLPLAVLWPQWHGDAASTRRRPRMTADSMLEALRALG